MVNMTNLIKQDNARVLKNQEHMGKRSYNCRVKDNCPLDGKYLHKCIVLCIKQMSLPIKHIKSTSEQLKDSLNCATIITQFHLDTRRV